MPIVAAAKVLVVAMQGRMGPIRKQCWHGFDNGEYSNWKKDFNMYCLLGKCQDSRSEPQFNDLECCIKQSEDARNLNLTMMGYFDRNLALIVIDRA